MEQNDLQIDLSYLKPPQQAHDLVHDNYYIKHGEGVKGTRKIYEFVSYDAFEEHAIKEIEEECRKQKVILPEDWKRSDFLKMQYSGKCKIKESMKKLLMHVEWRNNPTNHCLNESSIKFLENGLIYLHGRDKEYRPIIILNAYQLDPKKQHTKEMIVQALSFLMGSVRRYMMIPNKVENWIFMLETNKIGVFGLPLKNLGIIIDCMSVNFCGCLDKMYILNPSSGLDFTWGAIQGLIDPETKQKINFVTAKTMDKIKERVSPDQLEKKYGGTCENLTKFWPPINLDLPGGYPTKDVTPETIPVSESQFHQTPAIVEQQMQETPNLKPIVHEPVIEPLPLDLPMKFEETQPKRDSPLAENPQSPEQENIHHVSILDEQHDAQEPNHDPLMSANMDRSNVTHLVTFGKVSQPYFESQQNLPRQQSEQIEGQEDKNHIMDQPLAVSNQPPEENIQPPQEIYPEIEGESKVGQGCCSKTSCVIF